MGHNIFEFTHPEDHEEIRSNLRLTTGVCMSLCVYVCVCSACLTVCVSSDEVCCGVRRDVVMRVKSALSHRGRNATFKSATWKVGAGPC